MSTGASLDKMAADSDGETHDAPLGKAGKPLGNARADGADLYVQQRTASYFRPRDPLEAPLRKLTVNLIHTYKHINEMYYAAKQKRLQSPTKSSSKLFNNGYDDEEYNYKVHENELFHDRYIIDKRIGKGSFGQVVRAYDRKSKKHVAIKIIKSRKPFTKQAQTEINLLEFLNRKDPEDKWFIVQLQEHFVHRNHTCLVFELLSYNLYDLLRNTSFHGVSLNLIRKFGVQLLQALAFLSLPEINVVHCDLKPENILLRHPRRSAIKVIDFGSSCYGEKRMYKYIQSRFYRSPEVILGLEYGVTIDMWSLGCILVEMHTGEPLFNGTDEYDQIRRIVEMRGLPPRHLLKASPKVKQFFSVDKSGEYSIRPRASSSSSSSHSGKGRQTLEEVLGIHTGGPGGRRKGEAGHSLQNYTVFVDLIDKMLQFDPKERIKPIQALHHPFFGSMQRIMSGEISAGAGGAADGAATPARGGEGKSGGAAGAQGKKARAGGGKAGGGEDDSMDVAEDEQNSDTVEKSTQTPRKDEDEDGEGDEAGGDEAHDDNDAAVIDVDGNDVGM